jgi:hypothetical protein
MKWRVLTLVQFLPKYHMISMEERFARASGLGMTYMCYSMWIIDTQPMVDWYSRSNDMASVDAWAILAQIPYDFYGGEICTSVDTLHNIHVIHNVDSILNECVCHCRYSRYVWINTQGSMIWTVPTLKQFCPKYHRISMEKRFARAFELCTTWLISDAMMRCDNETILARTP